MAHLRKKGKNYYAEFYNPDRKPSRKWVALKTHNRSVANIALVELEKKQVIGEYDPWVDSYNAPTTVSAAIKGFIESRDHCVGHTVAHYRSVLSLFERSVGGSAAISTLSSDDVKVFVSDPTRSEATNRNYYRHTRAFVRWAQDEGYLKHDVLKGIRLPKRQSKVPLFLTETQLETLLETIRDEYELNAKWHGEDYRTLWLDQVVVFACYTGLRRSEICNLRWKHVDLESRRITVANTTEKATKSGRERSVPLASKALAVLEGLNAQSECHADSVVFSTGSKRSLDPDYLSKQFRRHRELAGLSKAISFHSLRHTCASWLVMKGVSLYVVKEVLGHSSIEVTQRYAHLAPDTMQAELVRAFG